MSNLIGLPKKVRKKIKRIFNIVSPWSGPKIFCISLQRTGTTSTGRFFKDHGYSVATYGVSKANTWTLSYFQGDFEKIFKSKDFKRFQVFEDDPWWLGDFYKVLYHRLPNSKFILLERDSDKWFDSMVSHSGGKTLGNTHLHCSFYQRLGDYYKLMDAEWGNVYTGVVDNALPLGEGQREHYTRFYRIRNDEVKLFFRHHDENRLFNAGLEDEGLWQKMGDFFNIDVIPEYNVHVNKSSDRQML
jgi:hypothetical protein